MNPEKILARGPMAKETAASARFVSHSFRRSSPAARAGGREQSVLAAVRWKDIGPRGCTLHKILRNLKALRLKNSFCILRQKSPWSDASGRSRI